jgi:LAS superfamily LD-carboxypeptidase LdcB
MAEDILGKAVRIDEKKYVPKGAKLEVWTKGRHKYLVKHGDPKGIQSPPTDTIRYLNGEKISASLSDDEVIKAFIEESERISIAATAIQVKPFPPYKVIQDPYSDEPPKRVYGDGKSPYYLNNGCKIFIEWRGFIPNPEFVLGTFSTAEEAKQASGPGDPDRLLSKQLITSDKDISKFYDIPPFSTWIVPTGEVNAALQPVPNYRDGSSVSSKKITIHLPDGFTENGGKGYLIFAKNEQIRYSTDTTAIEDTNRLQNVEDYKIVERVIEIIKRMVKELHGIADYDLKLCSPDSEACKIIDYKSPLEPPNKTTTEAAVDDTPPVPTKTIVKLKFNIEGLPEVVEVKAKEDLPTFTVWAGSIPKPVGEQVDDFEDLSELDDEYKESAYQGKEEGTMVFESQEYPSEEIRKQTEQNAQKVNELNYTPGKHKLDMIPGIFKGNGGMEISCCQIHGKPVNIKIADSLLDLIEAAKNDGVTVRVASGFRPDFYPNVNAKSESGVSVQAQSQEELYKQNCSGGNCNPDTARPGKSKHGSGIAIDFNTGSKETLKFRPLNESVYKWMIKNSWKFGFVRTVSSEEWHFEYWPTESKSGPYAKVSKSNNQYWSYLGLNNLQPPNWS